MQYEVCADCYSCSHYCEIVDECHRCKNRSLKNECKICGLKYLVGICKGCKERKNVCLEVLMCEECHPKKCEMYHHDNSDCSGGGEDAVEIVTADAVEVTTE